MEPKGNDMAGDELVEAAARVLCDRTEDSLGLPRGTIWNAPNEDGTCHDGASYKDDARAMLDAARLSRSTSTEAVAWQDVARRAGVCMSCALGMQEPCTDCMGTGWDGGAPSGFVRSDRIDADVARLVVAARLVAFEDQSSEALKRLDKASEAFAGRVPWDDEPTCPSLQGGAEPDEDKHIAIHVYDGDSALVVRDNGNKTLHGVQLPELLALFSEPLPTPAVAFHSLGETGGTDELVGETEDKLRMYLRLARESRQDWKAKAEAAESSLAAEKLKVAELERERADDQQTINEQWGSLMAISGALGSVRFMDPPDGGDVTVAEQVTRMRLALEAAEQRVAALVGALTVARYWLIEENFAEGVGPIATIDAALATEA